MSGDRMPTMPPPPRTPSVENAAPERRREKFPSAEEVRGMFKKFFEKHSPEAFAITREESDADGLLICEAEGKDRDGDRMDLNFQRAKYDHTNPTLPASLRFEASIHTVLYMGDVPCGGECVANYVNGEWVDIPAGDA